ncbi:MAG TPA: hypothetical protein VIU14_02985 [Mesorhizobium sp.]|jgi:hypothetical protein
MMKRPNLALLEIANAERVAALRAQRAQHPLAEYFGEWQRQRVLQAPASSASSFAISLNGDED